MLTQSKETRDAWRASQRTLDIKVTIDGKTYGATDINSLKYDSGAYNGDTFAIGSTYSNTVQIEFSHLIEGLKLGMEVHPSIGIKTSSGYVYEPLGVFIISSEIKMDRNNNLTTVSASDRFCGLEGTYVSKLTYPAKVLDVIAEICAQSGVKANTDDLARLPHQADLPAPITGQSYRKALGWIAQLYVGYALFDRQGLFTIRTISEPNYELDPSQYEQAGLTKNEAAYKINGIQCQVTLTTKTRDGESTEETKNYQAGDATGSQIKLENNIMTPQRLNDIWEQLKDLTFYPFSLNWFGNPAVEAGDWLRLEDKQGNSFVVPNSSYTLDFNGGLSATSKADQTTSSDQMVPWQGSVAQTIKELKIRRLPDGTVVFPPSVTAPPTNAKFNDVWFKKNGNSTELWIFEKQDDGAGKWIRKDLSDDEIKKKVADAQQGLNQAKADIINNKQKADTDIENLNKSIEANKKAADQDIQNLNKSIEANKKVADESLKKLNDSVTNLQGQYDNNVVPNLNRVMADASDALQKYITAQNSIVDLTKQAQQQGKDIADVTNTVKGLNINYANLAGDVSSTKVDVKGLQTTIGTANGDIAQLKLDAQNLQTMLAGKVDNTTYTNFVNLTNQALNARLTASDLNGYAKTADVQATANGLRVDLNSVTDRMNNLKVGGVNLISNGNASLPHAKPWQNTFLREHPYYFNGTKKLFLLQTKTSTELVSESSGWFPLEAGKEYTISFKGFMSDNVSSYDIWLLGKKFGKAGSWTNAYNVISEKRLSSGHVEVATKTFKVPSDWKDFEAHIRFDNNGSTDGKDSYFFFNEVALREGTLETGWSPAPGDTQQSLSELSAQIDATSKQFTSYYTKSEVDGRANSAKNDAVSTIKGDGNWQGLSNILTNSGFLQTADGFLQKVQQTAQPMINANNGGGINLFTGTKDYSDWRLFNQGAFEDITELPDDRIKTKIVHVYGVGKDNFFMYRKPITMQAGEYYTISFLCRYYQQPDVAEKVVNYPINFFSDYTDHFTGGGPLIQIHQVSNKWVQYSATFKIEHSGTYGRWRIVSYSDKEFPGGSLYFANIKLERGRVVTPWTPAPDDMATQTAFTQLSQTIKGLQSTVSGNYGNLQSQLSQTATTIRGELTNNVTGLQNQITANASGITALIQGNPVSLIRKGSFEDGSKGMWDNSATIVDVNNNNVPFTKALCISKRDSYEGKRINVTPGDHYLVKAWIKSDEAQNNRVSVGLFLIKKDGKVDWINGAITVNHDWELVTGEITIPNDVVAAEGWIQIDATQNFGHAYLADISITKISDKTMQVAATLDGLQSTVSNNYGSLQSQINQTATTIRGEITDRINGVQGQITATANGLSSVTRRVGSLETLTNVQIVNNAINANDYTATGDYFIRSTANTNVPGPNWCYLEVKKANDGRITQVWQADNDPTLKFTRNYISNSGWTNWQRAASYAEYSSLNQTVQGLQSTVSNNYGTLNSQISQTASTIRQEVNDHVNNLQGQITTQADNINLTIGSTGDLSNICRNPDFMDGSTNGWENIGSSTGNGSSPSKYYGGIQSRDAYYGKWFPVAAGDKYYFSTYAWQDQSTNQFSLGLVYEKKDGHWDWQSGVVFKPSEGFNTKTGSLTIPNYAVKARIWVHIEAYSDFGHWWFTNVNVRKNDTLAQINMSAGATLIQNDKIYMDASSTVFSGNAFIPSAAITSLTADKITAGTINGAKVNVINLNANNITAGTLRGSNGEFYLDSGSLHVWQNNHDAWIDQNGIHDYDNSGNNVWIKKGGISAYGNTSSIDIRDGEIHLNKKMGISDGVLASDYGNIKKVDNILQFGTSGLDITGTDGFILKTNGWDNSVINRMSGEPINGSGMAGNKAGYMQLGAGRQIILYAGSPVSDGKAKEMPRLVLGGALTNGESELNGWFSSYRFTSPSGSINGGFTLGQNSVLLNSFDGKSGLFTDSNSATLTAGDKYISVGGIWPGVKGDFNVSGNFTVSGSKNAIVPTSRGMAAINAYETAEYYFGDIGETQTNDDGVVTVMIDPYFLETVNTLVPYKVFLTSYGDGNVWVSSRSANNFTVKSSNPNIHFAWEIKAKRKGYENDRMKIVKGVFNNE
ncbi:hypothetical protein LMB39_08755 [Limosilactobacillus reuteri]|uniref:gp58-like family protein n=1 Tax=Limosilactobacillus reuteri TaxID=1598 RepID=UPI001E2ACB0C|nr:gp58-like family protein [Limosilactobacillus reuteri]MCC4347626.1 hypothetical protein [Limosilactobacillus reuteri]MCC4385999.1 hypothetical protein [Limosilactobacillus reuteri]